VPATIAWTSRAPDFDLVLSSKACSAQSTTQSGFLPCSTCADLNGRLS
jgi:hypothetical protein